MDNREGPQRFTYELDAMECFEARVGQLRWVREGMGVFSGSRVMDAAREHSTFHIGECQVDPLADPSLSAI